jgi:AbrB family looped-hinge helix DNA binding protein
MNRQPGRARSASAGALIVDRDSATVTSKGQITLPKAIRNLLRLDAGDRVDFVVSDDGTVVRRPATVDVRELTGPAPQEGH